ncbi:MAG TPA: hypothetical protein VMR90_15845 [Candidatus Cybelea sp.]|nr:hypothetical protein [Candidatus Cybelea sp.]
MRVDISEIAAKQRKKISVQALLVLACAALALSLAAQQQGPLTPPRTAAAAAPSTPAPASAQASAAPQETSSHIINELPPIPVQEIIQKFAEHEGEFRRERDNFTYTQIFVFQELDDDGQPDGEYRLTSDILFTPAGKRYEKVVEAPAPSLKRISMSQQDFDDIEKVWPLVLTQDELPKYDVKYVGKEQIDEVGTYVFDIIPKKLEKGQRYFDGRVWVDDKDLQIVKTHGKATGLLKKKEDQAFPTFETFRENIEGHYWFPTYTRADDYLRFKTGQEVHIRLSVRYQNYKRFGSTVKIGKATQVDPDKPDKP